MARMPRRRSASGVYHIMLRGVNKQMIFLSEADNLKFLQSVEQAKEISRFELLGYCLMGNHIHLLIKEHPEGEEIGVAMKRILNRFVVWYNLSYERCGPLFQGRYRSEPVEDERYLLTVLRYIHQNPVKAKLCRRMADYKWSSYRDYADGHGVLEGLVDTDDALDVSGRAELLRFFEEASEECCLDDLPKEVKMQQYSAIYHEITCGQEFAQLSTERQREIIAACKAKGIPVNKIVELTGRSYYILSKI